MASNSGPPAPTRNGTYGTPKIIAGRVHPLKRMSFFKLTPKCCFRWL